VANGVNVALHKSNMSMFSSSTPCATTSSSIGRPGTGLMQSAGTRLMTKAILTVEYQTVSGVEC
jgi:hypothetical protein